MFAAEGFLSDLVKTYGKYLISTDAVTWYIQACRFLGLDHHLHFSCEKKHNRENKAVHKGQNGEFRRLLSV
ncbi:hypothetical protein BH23THE1_BH23THE1_23550 [soil metagenome]